MILNKEELKRIETFIQADISAEVSLIEIPVEMIDNGQKIAKILIETQVSDLTHNLYHQLKDEVDCGCAILSLITKMFRLGYECRQAKEESDELVKTFSASNAS